MTIAELKDGMTVEDLSALVVEKRVATAKNGKQYADLVVRDKTASIKCKVWSFDHVLDGIVQPGKVFDISGRVSSYLGELQLVVDTFIASERTPNEFAKTSRFSIDDMYETIKSMIASMEEPLTKSVADSLVDFYLNTQAPAAIKMHNAWEGGLVEHIHSMLLMFPGIVNNYLGYQKKISRDKVIFGIIAHDIGKVLEYDYRNPAYAMSPQGLLVNHLVMGPAMIYELCNKWLDSKAEAVQTTEEHDDYLKDPIIKNFIEERDHLMHIVAAHHGTLEFGSPVVPSTLEAIIVHQLDLLDSKMMHAIELIEGKEGPVPGFSERSWAEKTSYMLYK